jgi:hypothetical protein
MWSRSRTSKQSCVFGWPEVCLIDGHVIYLAGITTKTWRRSRRSEIPISKLPSWPSGKTPCRSPRPASRTPQSWSASRNKWRASKDNKKAHTLPATRSIATQLKLPPCNHGNRLLHIMFWFSRLPTQKVVSFRAPVWCMMRYRGGVGVHEHR